MFESYDLFRLYAYVGPPEILDASRSANSGAVIKRHEELLEWLRSNSADTDLDGSLTVTFVVDKNGDLRLAPRRSEHVACAAGGPVLSAGEMMFASTGEVIDVNNHSTGFCPEPESWPVCEKALSRLGVDHPGGFTKSVVFRLCPKCKERNVVKDEWFSCDLCGSDLPNEWNFQTAD
jgi:hypothetical protein